MSAPTPEPRVTFFGAAGQVTGSMHLLEAAGARILLDAGLFQGRRAEARKQNAELPIDPRRIDAVILSHAHIDHSGRLPLLLKHGFHSPIFATPATRDLLALLLSDSAYLQQKDFEFLQKRGRAGPASEPLYTIEDAIEVQRLIVGLPFRRMHHLRKHLQFEFTEAGHIFGAASICVTFNEGKAHRLVFSGDVGRSHLPIIRDPDPPSGPVDTLIVSSTYAHRSHGSLEDSEKRLGEVVREVAGKGGKLLVPAFAVGRTQELVYSLHQLYRSGTIPGIPIYIDSPLAVKATDVFRLHPELYDLSEPLMGQSQSVFDFPLVHYVRSTEESKALNNVPGPAIIIAGSGMAEGGRILHHLVNNIGDHRCRILIVGFQAANTLGRRLQEGEETVKIFGQEFHRLAQVETLGGYSAHADGTELRDWLRRLGGPIKRAFVVHGEPAGLEAMSKILRSEGVREVVVPRLGESFDLA